MELERNQEALAREGLKSAAVSYDTVEILKNFSDRRGVHYPLLSDPESKIIRAFGLLNTSLKSDSPIYGVPRPGLLLVDENGVVKEKFFEDDYRERYTVAGILASKFGFRTTAAPSHAETPHLMIDSSSSNSVVRGGQRITLVLDLELSKGFHAYAPGVSAEYIPVRWDVTGSEAWKVHDPSFPTATAIDFAGERVPVFSGRFRVTRDVTLAAEKVLRKSASENHELAVSGSFRYQACDDRQCFPPETLPIEWRIRIEPHDSERVPTQIRRLK